MLLKQIKDEAVRKALQECADKGMVLQEASDFLGVSYYTILYYVKKLGIKFPRPVNAQHYVKKLGIKFPRPEMVADMKAGLHNSAIAIKNNISRERVRQLRRRFQLEDESIPDSGRPTRKWPELISKEELQQAVDSGEIFLQFINRTEYSRSTVRMYEKKHGIMLERIPSRSASDITIRIREMIQNRMRNMDIAKELKIPAVYAALVRMRMRVKGIDVPTSHDARRESE